MKFITFTSALFIAMVAGTPLANAGSGLVERDITPEELQLHKRECPEHPVPNPLCPTGAFMVSFRPLKQVRVTYNADTND